MVAKGNRSRRSPRRAASTAASTSARIGGPAARLAQDCIRKVEVLEYAELGMEAVWRIEVEDFPAFIVVDDKGNDFFAETVSARRHDDPGGPAARLKLAGTRPGRRRGTARARPGTHARPRSAGPRTPTDSSIDLPQRLQVSGRSEPAALLMCPP